jgi:hypothetical protein
MRLVITRCSVDDTGRLSAHLPLATRLLLVKADGSVLVHSDGGAYKPLNWMAPPCVLVQELLADRCTVRGDGWSLVRQGYSRHRSCLVAPRRSEGTVLQPASQPRGHDPPCD